MGQRSKKQANRLKRLRKTVWKFIITILLIDLLLAFFFLTGIRVNTPLAKQQLRTVSGIVEDAYAYRVTHIANLVIVTIDGQEYTLSWKDGTEQPDTYARYLSATKPYVTITIVEQQPVASLIKGWQKIVAISDEQYSFDFSEAINRDMVSNRSICTFLGISLGFVLPPFEALLLYLHCGEYWELKRPRKARNQSAKH